MNKYNQHTQQPFADLFIDLSNFQTPIVKVKKIIARQMSKGK